MSKREYTKEQPKHGDLVMHCFHTTSNVHHFYKGNFKYANILSPPESSEVPLQGTAKWLIVCDDCFNKVEGDIHKISFCGVCGVSFWQTNKPIVLKQNTH